jgi:hypothetical protein
MLVSRFGRGPLGPLGPSGTAASRAIAPSLEAQETTRWVTPSPPLREDATTASHATETPMTGESARGSASEKSGALSPRRGRKGAIALRIGAAAGVALVAFGMSRFSRSPVRGIPPIEGPDRNEAAGLGASMGERPSPTSARSDPPAPSIATASEPTRAQGAAEDIGPTRDGGSGAVAKTAAPMRAAPRAAVVKPRVPDDGRDELYIPGAP